MICDLLCAGPSARKPNAQSAFRTTISRLATLFLRCPVTRQRLCFAETAGWQTRTPSAWQRAPALVAGARPRRVVLAGRAQPGQSRAVSSLPVGHAGIFLGIALMFFWPAFEGGIEWTTYSCDRVVTPGHAVNLLVTSGHAVMGLLCMFEWLLAFRR